jgi:hypothetical protein
MVEARLDVLADIAEVATDGPRLSATKTTGPGPRHWAQLPTQNPRPPNQSP